MASSFNNPEVVSLVKRHYALINAGDLDAAFALMSDDVLLHIQMNHMKGPLMLKKMTESARHTFSDYEEEVIDIMGSGDRVCVRGLRKGKHTRQFGQLKASGREVATSFLAIFRVENGKIVERWINHDDLSFMRAIGAMGGGHPGGQGHSHGGQGHSHGGQGHSHGGHGHSGNQRRHPTSPSNITAEWLTHSLHRGGHTKAKVKSFSIREQGGATEQFARLKLAYEGRAGDSPTEMVVRFPIANPMAKQLFKEAQTHIRLVRFHEQLAPRAKGLSTPKSLFSFCDGMSGDYILLTSDISLSSKRLSNLEGVGLKEVQSLLKQLAIFHAQWWKSGDDLKPLEWLKSAPATELTYSRFYENSWKALEENYPLSDEIKKLGGLLCKKLPDLFAYHRSSSPRTLCHNDLSPSSLLQGQNGEWFIEAWNEVSIGHGARDVSSFLCQSLSPELRKAHESDLIRLYHQTLQAEGVSGYKYQKCWGDYKIFVLLSFAQFVCNGAGLFVAEKNGQLGGPQKEKLEEFKAIYSRLTAAISDLACYSLLCDFKL